MLKTNLFSDTDPENFVNKLNEFIKDKDVVDIHYQTFPIQTAWQNGAPIKGEIVDRVLVVYKEAEEKKEEPNDDIKHTHWYAIVDIDTCDRVLKCANCGHTLDYPLLGGVLPASCPRCGGITKQYDV